MRIIIGSWLFYRKLIVPSLVLSVFLSFLQLGFMDIYAGIGISYIILVPFFHFFTYEVTHPEEYYFYYNLGLSKVVLWMNTIITSLIIGLILIII
jgi:hypothetical protein